MVYRLYKKKGNKLHQKACFAVVFRKAELKMN